MTRKQGLFLGILGVELNQSFKVEGIPWSIYKFIYKDDNIMLMTKTEYDDDEWDYSDLDWENLLISEVIPL